MHGALPPDNIFLLALLLCNLSPCHGKKAQEENPLKRFFSDVHTSIKSVLASKFALTMRLLQQDFTKYFRALMARWTQDLAIRTGEVRFDNLDNFSDEEILAHAYMIANLSTTPKSGRRAYHRNLNDDDDDEEERDWYIRERNEALKVLPPSNTSNAISLDNTPTNASNEHALRSNAEDTTDPSLNPEIPDESLSPDDGGPDIGEITADEEYGNIPNAEAVSGGSGNSVEEDLDSGEPEEMGNEELENEEPESEVPSIELEDAEISAIDAETKSTAEDSEGEPLADQEGDDEDDNNDDSDDSDDDSKQKNVSLKDQIDSEIIMNLTSKLGLSGTNGVSRENLLTKSHDLKDQVDSAILNLTSQLVGLNDTVLSQDNIITKALDLRNQVESGIMNLTARLIGLNATEEVTRESLVEKSLDLRDQVNSGITNLTLQLVGLNISDEVSREILISKFLDIRDQVDSGIANLTFQIVGVLEPDEVPPENLTDTPNRLEPNDTVRNAGMEVNDTSTERHFVTGGTSGALTLTNLNATAGINISQKEMNLVTNSTADPKITTMFMSNATLTTTSKLSITGSRGHSVTGNYDTSKSSPILAVTPRFSPTAIEANPAGNRVNAMSDGNFNVKSMLTPHLDDKFSNSASKFNSSERKSFAELMIFDAADPALDEDSPLSPPFTRKDIIIKHTANLNTSQPAPIQITDEEKELLHVKTPWQAEVARLGRDKIDVPSHLSPHFDQGFTSKENLARILQSRKKRDLSDSVIEIIECDDHDANVNVKGRKRKLLPIKSTKSFDSVSGRGKPNVPSYFRQYFDHTMTHFPQIAEPTFLDETEAAESKSVPKERRKVDRKQVRTERNREIAKLVNSNLQMEEDPVSEEIIQESSISSTEIFIVNKNKREKLHSTENEALPHLALEKHHDAQNEAHLHLVLSSYDDSPYHLILPLGNSKNTKFHESQLPLDNNTSVSVANLHTYLKSVAKQITNETDNIGTTSDSKKFPRPTIVKSKQASGGTSTLNLGNKLSLGKDPLKKARATHKRLPNVVINRPVVSAAKVYRKKLPAKTERARKDRNESTSMKSKVSVNPPISLPVSSPAWDKLPHPTSSVPDPFQFYYKKAITIDPPNPPDQQMGDISDVFGAFSSGLSITNDFLKSSNRQNKIFPTISPPILPDDIFDVMGATTIDVLTIEDPPGTHLARSVVYPKITANIPVTVSPMGNAVELGRLATTKDSTFESSNSDEEPLFHQESSFDDQSNKNPNGESSFKTLEIVQVSPPSVTDHRFIPLNILNRKINRSFDAVRPSSRNTGRELVGLGGERITKGANHYRTGVSQRNYVIPSFVGQQYSPPTTRFPYYAKSFFHYKLKLNTTKISSVSGDNEKSRGDQDKSPNHEIPELNKVVVHKEKFYRPMPARQHRTVDNKRRTKRAAFDALMSMIATRWAKANNEEANNDETEEPLHTDHVDLEPDMQVQESVTSVKQFAKVRPHEVEHPFLDLLKSQSHHSDFEPELRMQESHPTVKQFSKVRSHEVEHPFLDLLKQQPQDAPRSHFDLIAHELHSKISELCASFHAAWLHTLTATTARGRTTPATTDKGRSVLMTIDKGRSSQLIDRRHKRSIPDKVFLSKAFNEIIGRKKGKSKEHFVPPEINLQGGQSATYISNRADKYEGRDEPPKLNRIVRYTDASRSNLDVRENFIVPSNFADMMLKADVSSYLSKEPEMELQKSERAYLGASRNAIKTVENVRKGRANSDYLPPSAHDFTDPSIPVKMAKRESSTSKIIFPILPTRKHIMRLERKSGPIFLGPLETSSTLKPESLLKSIENFRKLAKLDLEQLENIDLEDGFSIDELDPDALRSLTTSDPTENIVEIHALPSTREGKFVTRSSEKRIQKTGSTTKTYLHSSPTSVLIMNKILSRQNVIDRGVDSTAMSPTEESEKSVTRRNYRTPDVLKDVAFPLDSNDRLERAPEKSHHISPRPPYDRVGPTWPSPPHSADEETVTIEDTMSNTRRPTKTAPLSVGGRSTSISPSYPKNDAFNEIDEVETTQRLNLYPIVYNPLARPDETDETTDTEQKKPVTLNLDSNPDGDDSPVDARMPGWQSNVANQNIESEATTEAFASDQIDRRHKNQETDPSEQLSLLTQRKQGKPQFPLPPTFNLGLSPSEQESAVTIDTAKYNQRSQVASVNERLFSSPPKDNEENPQFPLPSKYILGSPFSEQESATTVDSEANNQGLSDAPDDEPQFPLPPNYNLGEPLFSLPPKYFQEKPQFLLPPKYNQGTPESSDDETQPPLLVTLVNFLSSASPMRNYSPKPMESQQEVPATRLNSSDVLNQPLIIDVTPELTEDSNNVAAQSTTPTSNLTFGSSEPREQNVSHEFIPPKQFNRPEFPEDAREAFPSPPVRLDDLLDTTTVESDTIVNVNTMNKAFTKASSSTSASSVAPSTLSNKVTQANKLTLKKYYQRHPADKMNFAEVTKRMFYTRNPPTWRGTDRSIIYPPTTRTIHSSTSRRTTPFTRTSTTPEPPKIEAVTIDRKHYWQPFIVKDIITDALRKHHRTRFYNRSNRPQSRLYVKEDGLFKKVHTDPPSDSAPPEAVLIAESSSETGKPEIKEFFQTSTSSYMKHKRPKHHKHVPKIQHSTTTEA